MSINPRQRSYNTDVFILEYLLVVPINTLRLSDLDVNPLNHLGNQQRDVSSHGISDTLTPFY